MEAPFTVMKLVMVALSNPDAIAVMSPAVPNPPIPVTSQRFTYCVTCTALGRPYPTLFPWTISPPNPNWSDSKEYWDGKRQKEKERREKEQKENGQKEIELKSENNKKEEYYPPSPQYVPYSPSGFDDDTLAPTLTDTLPPAPEKTSNEKQDKDEDTKDKETDSETEYDLDDTMDILQSEII